MEKVSEIQYIYLGIVYIRKEYITLEQTFPVIAWMVNDKGNYAGKLSNELESSYLSYLRDKKINEIINDTNI